MPGLTEFAVTPVFTPEDTSTDRTEKKTDAEILIPAYLFLVACVLVHWCWGRCAALCGCKWCPSYQRSFCHRNERSPPVPSCGWRSWGWRYVLNLSVSSGLKQKREQQLLTTVETTKHDIIRSQSLCRLVPSRRVVRRNGPRWLVAKEISSPSLVNSVGRPKTKRMDVRKKSTIVLLSTICGIDKIGSKLNWP